MGFQELSKLKLQVTLESNFLNWSTRFQVFSKQSMHNQQENMTVGVHVAQNITNCGFVDALENKVACKLVAYQEDGHRLRACRLQSRQSRKLIANLLNTESWELWTRYWKLSNLPIHLPCDFSVDVPLPEITTQHRDPQDWSSVLSTPYWTVQFSEAAWSSTTGSIKPPRGNTGQEQQDTRDLVKHQQTPNLCELYTEVYNMQ
jgi:hypothetical protein